MARKKETGAVETGAVETAEVGTVENGEEITVPAQEEEIITQEGETGEEEGEALSEESLVKETIPIEQSNLTESDVSNFEEEMNQGTAFLRRSVTLPGKRKQKLAFREEEEIIGDESGELETEASGRKREYEILVDSAKSQKPKVLYGRMTGTEVMKVGDAQTVMAVCRLIADNAADINTEREIRTNIFKIKIPAPLFFFDPDGRYSGDENFDDLKYNMDTRVGSIIEFIVYNINPSEDDVLASRINAMQILEYDNYLGKRARVKPGSKVKGRIVYANRLGVTVDVLGADVFITRKELSWKYIPNILTEKEFKVGMPVAVRVTSVETDSADIYGRKYPYVKIKASVKDARENPNKRDYDKYAVGQKYGGMIAYHLTTGNYIVNLGDEGSGVNGEQPVCICKAPSVPLGGVPYVGQRCSVAIIAKNEETYQFFGAFTYMEQK